MVYCPESVPLLGTQSGLGLAALLMLHVIWLNIGSGLTRLLHSLTTFAQSHFRTPNVIRRRPYAMYNSLHDMGNITR